MLDNLKNYDALYKDIKLNGYDKEYPIRTLITRDGDYIIWDGKHRATSAKLLGLNSLTVNIRPIHQSWLELRDDVYNNRLPKERKEPPSHPDLQIILD